MKTHTGNKKKKGEDTEFLIELASGSNGGRSPRHGRTQMTRVWKILEVNNLRKVWAKV